MRLARLRPLLLVLAIGCHGRTPPGADGAIVTLGPVPLPEGTLAEAVVFAPNAFWTKLQRGVAGPLALLPATFGGLVCVAGGIDPRAAELVEGGAPAFAVLARDGGRLAFAIATRLRDPGRARATLLEGDAARFAVKRVDGEVTVLIPRGVAAPMAAALAGDYLLLAGSEEDLVRFGPYAYRTLPTHHLPSADASVVMPHAGLAPLHAQLRSMWNEARARLKDEDRDARAHHGGRAPDYGDAEAIVDTVDANVQDKLAVIADLEVVELTIDAGDADLSATVSVVPLPDKGPASELFDTMVTGDAAPLGQLPQDVTVGLLARDDPARRAHDAATMSLTFAKILGGRMADADNRRLQAALSDWAAARGDWVTLAVSLGVPALSVRTPAPRPELAVRAVRETVDLLKVAPFKDVLKSRLSVLANGVSAVDVGDAGSFAALASFAHQGETSAPDAGTPAQTYGVAWMLREQDLYLAVAADAKERMLEQVSSSSKLVDDAPTAAALRALSDTSSFALFARPFATKDGGPVPQMVFGWGKSKGRGQARLVVSDALLRELLRREAGL